MDPKQFSSSPEGPRARRPEASDNGAHGASDSATLSNVAAAPLYLAFADRIDVPGEARDEIEAGWTEGSLADLPSRGADAPATAVTQGTEAAASDARISRGGAAGATDAAPAQASPLDIVGAPVSATPTRSVSAMQPDAPDLAAAPTPQAGSAGPRGDGAAPEATVPSDAPGAQDPDAPGQDDTTPDEEPGENPEPATPATDGPEPEPDTPDPDGPGAEPEPEAPAPDGPSPEPKPEPETSAPEAPEPPAPNTDIGALTDTDAAADGLAEDAGAGAAVGVVARAEDADASDTVSYGVDDDRFTVDADGTVRVADGATFDAETEGQVTITVTATSTDGSTSAETFTLEVADIDEFDVGPLTDTDAAADGLAEDAGAGTAVGVVAQAEDADASDTVSYGVDDDRFTVDADGTVRVADGAAFDAETEGQVTITVTATSTDGSTSAETFTLEVADIDEFDVGPLTDVDASGNRVEENAGGPHLFESVVTTTFRGEDSGHRNSGGVYTIEPDGTISNVHIAFGDDGSAAPGQVHSFSVTGSAATPVTGTFLVANGHNANGGYAGMTLDGDHLRFVYRLGTEDERAAKVTDAQADVTLVYDDGTGARALGGEIFHSTTGLNRDGKDHALETADGDGTLYSYEDLVGLGDRDYNDMRFAVDVATTPVETPGAEGGEAVGIQVHATDADRDDTVSYQVDDPRFSVDADGTVRLVAGARFDAETEPQVTITVTAASTDGSTTTETFTIDVGDVDEYDVGPVTDTDAAANAIVEDATAGTATGIIAHAVDADAGDTVTYSVDDARFVVDGDGTVRVAEAAGFDHAVELSVGVTVTATSSDGSSSVETFTLDIAEMNKAPVIDLVDTGGAITTQNYRATGDGFRVTGRQVLADGSLSSAEAGHVTARGDGLGVAGATAPSAPADQLGYNPNLGASEQLVVEFEAPVASAEFDIRRLVANEHGAAGDEGGSYTLYMNGTEVGRGSFVGDGGTAETLAVAPGSAFDRIVFAADPFANQGTWTGDSSDYFVHAVRFTSANGVAEDASAGAVAATLSAVDPNAGDTVTYGFVDAEGNAVDDASFEIVGDQIRVREGAGLDHEAAGFHDLIVRGTDAGGLSHDVAVRLHVFDADEHDVSPLADIDAAADGLAETATAGSAVGVTVLATDADATDAVRYDVDDARFTVGDDGAVRVAEGAVFDAETETVIALTVTATSSDGSNSARTFDVVVGDVDEHAVGAVTDADAGRNAVGEHAAVGSATGVTARAVDADATASVRYALSDDAGGRFAIDAGSGVVTVAGALDFETAASHSIEVMATSSDGSVSAERFDIDVLDAADAMTFDFSIAALEAPSWAPFGYVAASGSSGPVTWSVEDDANGFFCVDPQSGALTVNYHRMPSSFQPSYELAFHATSAEGADYAQSLQVMVRGTGSDIVQGDDADGVFWVDRGNDTVRAGGGDDTVVGLGGNDRIYGEAGDDLLSGGTGADLIDGGEGDDTASYVSSRSGVSVDLASGTGRGGDAQGDALTRVENVTGSAHADTLVGDAGDNAFSGMAGDDTLRGGAGDDHLDGGAGNDLFLYAAGDGSDTVAGGAGWTDAIEVEGYGGVVALSAAGAEGAGWTLALEHGAIAGQSGDALLLTQDASGTLTFDDGGQIEFGGIEEVRF